METNSTRAKRLQKEKDALISKIKDAIFICNNRLVNISMLGLSDKYKNYVEGNRFAFETILKYMEE